MTPRNLRQTIEAREADQRMARDSVMALTQVEARVNVRGSGEVRAEVTFPTVFSETPLMTFGGELDDNHTPQAGNFPVISAMVLEWTVIERSEDRVYFVGAEVGIVCLGKTRQRAIAHLKFEGMAFRDPAVRAGLGL